MIVIVQRAMSLKTNNIMEKTLKMEVITIEASAYQRLVDEIMQIKEFVKKLEISSNIQIASEWLTIEQTMKILNVSKRTLQSYRDNKNLGYSQICGKIFFKMSDIKEFLDRYYVPSSNSVNLHKKWVK